MVRNNKKKKQNRKLINLFDIKESTFRMIVYEATLIQLKRKKKLSNPTNKNSTFNVILSNCKMKTNLEHIH